MDLFRYREEHTPDRVWAIAEGKPGLKFCVVGFYRLGDFIC